MTEERPMKEYYFALIGESIAIFKEIAKVKTGMKKLTQVEKEDLSKRKDWIHAEIQRVRKLL